jgi:hypothetical protein
MDVGSLKQAAKKKVTISLTEDEWRYFYAYAHVKGFGTSQGIASLARTAIVEKIARNAPTEAQKKRIEELVGDIN